MRIEDVLWTGFGVWESPLTLHPKGEDVQLGCVCFDSGTLHAGTRLSLGLECSPCMGEVLMQEMLQ